MSPLNLSRVCVFGTVPGMGRGFAQCWFGFFFPLGMFFILNKLGQAM